MQTTLLLHFAALQQVVGNSPLGFVFFISESLAMIQEITKAKPNDFIQLSGSQGQAKIGQSAWLPQVF